MYYLRSQAAVDAIKFTVDAAAIREEEENQVEPEEEVADENTPPPQDVDAWRKERYPNLNLNLPYMFNLAYFYYTKLQLQHYDGQTEVRKTSVLSTLLQHYKKSIKKTNR